MAKIEYAPMPSSIVVGDKIRLKDARRGPYCRAYGRHLEDSVWQVASEDRVQGRRRLIVNETPTCIWIGDARLAYKAQSKERREHLTSLGVKLP